MSLEIRGRFINGKVELLEESDLEEGEEVRVIVPLREKERNEKSFMSTSGAWKDDAEYWDDFLFRIKERRNRSLRESRLPEEEFENRGEVAHRRDIELRDGKLDFIEAIQAVYEERRPGIRLDMAP